MQYLAIGILAAATFGLCFAVDKIFGRLFRSRSQHRSGRQVRLKKRLATFGLLVALLGLVCVIFGIGSQPVLFWAGLALLLMGGGILFYYMSFGIYYDDEGFLYSAFGKKSQLYRYSQIRAQQLYNSQGSILVELHLKDGTTVPVQDAMEGAEAFLDFAFARWCQESGVTKEACQFHDPGNSCWFPPVAEVE